MKTFAPVLLAAGIVSFATAQTYPVVTPDDVDQDTRDGWCTQQLAVCPLLCQDQAQVDAETNECDSATLDYKCICVGGTSPNLTEYSLTIPYYLCIQSRQMCADNCKGEGACASACFTGKQCGASNPTRVNSTATGTTSTGTATGTGTGTASGTATSTGDPFNTKGVGAIVESWGSAYGIGAMIVGMAVGFAGVL